MKLDFNGRIGADLAKPAAQGALAVSAPDASLLLRVAGLVFADFRGRPAAALTGDLTLAEGVVRLDGLKGAFDGVNFSGSLAYDRAAHLIGALTAEKLSASSLAALVLGPPEPAKAGALWPSLAFAAPAFNLPDARISLAVGEMDLGAALSPILGAARGLRMELAISPGRLDCDGLAFDLGRARLEGDVKLRRSGGEAWLGARLGVRGAALELAGASGRLDLNVEVSGVGKSADGLVAGLAGSGRARLGDLVLRRADPAALPRIVARFDSDGQHDLSAKTIAAALAAELKKADLQAGERAFDLSIASGVAAFASVPAKPEAPAIAVSLDLRRAMLMQRLSLVDPDPPKGWSGEPARIELSRKGPLAASAASRAPGVEIDAAALSNALANRAIERESARIEAFSFDIRERAFFYRRLASERRRQEERDRAERERTAAEAAQRALGPGEGQPASSRF